MSAPSLTCPQCKKALKTSRPLPAKTRVRCPWCSTTFAVAPDSPVIMAELVPLVEPRPVPRRQTAPTGDYQISLTRWEQTARPHYGAVTGPFIGFFFLMLLIMLLLYGLSLLLIGIPLLFIALATLPAGPTIVCLAQLKGQPWTFNDFFAALKRMGPYILGELLLSPLILVPLLPPLLMGVVLSLMKVNPRTIDAMQPFFGLFGMLVMLGVAAATFYVWFRLAIFSRQLIADRGFGAIQALKGSWELTRGHFWGLFGVFLLILFLVYLSGALTLGIGMLFTLPRALLVLNTGYLEISRARLGEPDDSDEEEPEAVGPARGRRQPAG
jgi:hypothetical protein